MLDFEDRFVHGRLSQVNAKVSKEEMKFEDIDCSQVQYNAGTTDDDDDFDAIMAEILAEEEERRKEQEALEQQER